MRICDDVKDYIKYAESNPNKINKDIKLLIKNIVKPLLKRDDVFFDEEKYKKCIKFCETNYYKFFPYQKFIIAFIFVYRKKTKIPEFRKFVIMMGRGNGKDGFILPVMHFLLTNMHGIRKYNIDIVANSEDQCKDSFNVVYDMMNLNYATKWKKIFYVTKELIQDRVTLSKLRYNTSNSATKDGKQSGAILFNEYHQYENYESIDVFESQQGKIDHPRIFIITTNGFVRDGPLDDLLKTCDKVLNTGDNLTRLFPCLYRLDSDEEVKDFDCWIKANPSIEFMPTLKEEITNQYYEALETPIKMNNFMTKRMNRPKSQNDMAVTSWENVEATNYQFDIEFLIKNKPWVIGIDYSKLSDMASITFLTKHEDVYYFIQENFINRQSKDWNRIHAPLEDWSICGKLNIIDEIEIAPENITGAILKYVSMGMNILGFALDNFRFALLRNSLKNDLSFNFEDRSFLKMIRPSNIMMVVPVIDSAFNKHIIRCGNNPVFRWGVSNTKLVSKSKGNFEYDKIEPKSRKNDTFMSFVHAMCISDKLDEPVITEIKPIKVYLY